MELGEHEGDMGAMPLPMLVASYGAPPPNIHESSKLKPPPPPNGDHHQNGSAGSPFDDTHHHHQQTASPAAMAVKKVVRYRECLKNHAASIGGHAIDGCGDFMPSGEEGTLEALKCAACNCHRNFHRREVEGEPPCYYCYNPRLAKDARRPARGAAPLMNPSPPLALPAASASNARYASQQMIMALGDETTGYMNTYVGGGGGSPLGGGGGMPVMKKRFRTKFTSEQKEKMSVFAEKLGWRIQKHDEAEVQQFCMDVGVKRHVLKVWMHNNKSNVLAKSTRDQCSNSQ